MWTEGYSWMLFTCMSKQVSNCDFSTRCFTPVLVAQANSTNKDWEPLAGLWLVLGAVSSQRCPSKLLVSLPSLFGNIWKANKLILWRIVGRKAVKTQPQKKAKTDLRSGPIFSERQITSLMKSHFEETCNFLIFFSLWKKYPKDAKFWLPAQVKK